VSKEEKNRRETEAMEKIQDILGRDTVAGVLPRTRKPPATAATNYRHWQLVNEART